MKKNGHNLKALSTTGPGTAAEIAKCCLDQGADLILVAGGDGTINEVVNGMVYSNVPVAILPGGTANVLAMETGIGQGMLAAAADVGNWIPERISLGIHKDGLERPPRHFLLMCGAGLDATIVYKLSASVKNSFGKASYWISGFSQLGRRFPEFTVEVDSERYRTSFALISRVRNYGGDLEIAPSVSLMEDEFEVVLFSGENSFRYLRYMYAIVTRQLQNVPGITIFRTTTVRLFAPEDRRIYTQIDGEYAGPLPAKVEIVPRALTLLLPAQYRQRRKSLPQPEWTTSHTR